MIARWQRRSDQLPVAACSSAIFVCYCSPLATYGIFMAQRSYLATRSSIGGTGSGALARAQRAQARLRCPLGRRCGDARTSVTVQIVGGTAALLLRVLWCCSRWSIRAGILRRCRATRTISRPTPAPFNQSPRPRGMAVGRPSLRRWAGGGSSSHARSFVDSTIRCPCQLPLPLCVDVDLAYTVDR